MNKFRDAWRSSKEAYIKSVAENRKKIAPLDFDDPTHVSLIEKFETVSLEFAKLFTALSGGAFVATLGLAQALLKDPLTPQWHLFKPYAIDALYCFALAAILGPVAVYLRGEYLNMQISGWRRTVVFVYRVSAFVPTCAIAALVTGGVHIIHGVEAAF